jgi:hypothetical protein
MGTYDNRGIHFLGSARLGDLQGIVVLLFEPDA